MLVFAYPRKNHHSSFSNLWHQLSYNLERGFLTLERGYHKHNQNDNADDDCDHDAASGTRGRTADHLSGAQHRVQLTESLLGDCYRQIGIRHRFTNRG